MTSVFINPFDFKTLIINYFLGNQVLFPFALVIIISYVCAWQQIPSNIFLIILTLASIMFGAYIGQAIYILVLFLVGFFLYKAFGRLLQ